jgi:hypothetical protein
MSAKQHIIQGHLPPGQPGNSLYIIYPPMVSLFLFDQVKFYYNAVTFELPDNRQVDPRTGNLVFDHTFPITQNPFDPGKPAFIGMTPDMQPTNTNRLILRPDCKTVRTSFPL